MVPLCPSGDPVIRPVDWEHLTVATLDQAPFKKQAPRWEGSSQYMGREKCPRRDMGCVLHPGSLAPAHRTPWQFGDQAKLIRLQTQASAPTSVFLLPVFSQVGSPGPLGGPAQPKVNGSHHIPYFGHCVGCRPSEAAGRQLWAGPSQTTLSRPQKSTQGLGITEGESA